MNALRMAKPEVYRTLEGDKIRVDLLPPADRELYHKLKKYFDSKPSHVDFNFYWQKEGDKVWGEKAQQGVEARREIADSPIFAICQDLDARLAERDGHLYTQD